MHTESEINLKHINNRTKKNPKLSKPFDLCSVKKRLSWNKIWNCFNLSRISFLSCKLHDAYPSLGSQIREKAKKIEIPIQITSWGTEIAIALNQTLRTKWLYTKLFLYYLVLKISFFLKLITLWKWKRIPLFSTSMPDFYRLSTIGVTNFNFNSLW